MVIDKHNFFAKQSSRWINQYDIWLPQPTSPLSSLVERLLPGRVGLVYAPPELLALRADVDLLALAQRRVRDDVVERLDDLVVHGPGLAEGVLGRGEQELRRASNT